MNRLSPARRAAGLAWLGALLAATSACNRLHTVETSEAAFIYGFIEVPESVGDANCVDVVQLERAAIGYRHGCMETSGEGLFFLANATPGRYGIDGFYVDDVHHNFGSSARVFTVAPGSLHYVGAFRYRRLVEPGVLRAGKFSLTPASRPTHAEVLKKLLGQELVDARWKRRIRARLAELGAGR